MYQKTDALRLDETISGTKTITYVARMVHQGSGVEFFIRAIIQNTASASGEGDVYFEPGNSESSSAYCVDGVRRATSGRYAKPPSGGRRRGLTRYGPG